MKKIKQTALLMLLAVMTTSLNYAQCPLPTGLSATSLSATSSQLNWVAVTGASFYNIEVQDGQNNPTPFRVTGNPTTNTFTVNGLTGGFLYKFKVRTRCSGGDKSNWSPWFQFVAGGGTINCVALTGLAITNITSTGATFNWNASAGGLGYAVRVEDASGNPVNFLFNTNTTANSFVMTGLNASSNYKVKIRKRCAPFVNGPWSSWVFFSTNTLRLSSSTNLEAANNLNVYPIPASSEIKVNYSNANAEIVKEINIIDVNGKLILSKPVLPSEQSKQYVLPTNSLSNGFYFLQVQTNTGNAITKIAILK